MDLYYALSLCILVLLSEILCLSLSEQQEGRISFDQNYQVSYGYDHVLLQADGNTAYLSLDKTTGAGIESKSSYSSGFFQMNIKPPGEDTAGVVTTFYLSSGDHEMRDELNFEFLGNRNGKPILLQTNIYKNGKGQREQRLKLWFDPAKEYHTYKILWNQYQIVFFVDNTPIRVFKNRGGEFLSKEMKVKATIWNGDSWATDGGREKINWGAAPFQAHYQDFGIEGCSSFNGGDCFSSDYWWNTAQFWNLSPEQESLYDQVKKKFMVYDYCDDKWRYPIPPHECR